MACCPLCVTGIFCSGKKIQIFKNKIPDVKFLNKVCEEFQRSFTQVLKWQDIGTCICVLKCGKNIFLRQIIKSHNNSLMVCEWYWFPAVWCYWPGFIRCAMYSTKLTTEMFHYFTFHHTVCSVFIANIQF